VYPNAASGGYCKYTQPSEEEIAKYRHVDYPAPRAASISGAVLCRLSAANLPEPASLLIPVKSKVTTADTEGYARDLIRKLPRTVRTGTVKIVGRSGDLAVE
jgi:hypothetical protein